MKKEIPKVFINKIKKINNNEEVFYSYKEHKTNREIEYNNQVNINEYDIQNKIDELFRANDFIYKKKFHIKTKYGEKDYIIISKSFDYLLTIDGEKIYIQNIIEIK